MKKSLQRRPSIESLETVMLLSGMGGAASVSAHQPIHLVGKFEASVTLQFPDISFGGSGTIKPLGHVTESTSVTNLAELDPQDQTFTLTTKSGKVFFTTIAQTSEANSISGQYVITGGTKAYAGATGSGNITIQLASLRRHKITEIFS